MSAAPLSLREQFTESLKAALKAGDKTRLGTVRLMQSALKDKDIEARGLGKGQMTDEEILAMLQKMVKQRQESIAIYSPAGRKDLADIEQAEIDVINTFLPQQMGETAVQAAIAAAVAETGAASMKDMGKVVAVLRAKYAGQMDFGKASQMVKACLGG